MADDTPYSEAYKRKIALRNSSKDYESEEDYTHKKTYREGLEAYKRNMQRRKEKELEKKEPEKAPKEEVAPKGVPPATMTSFLKDEVGKVKDFVHKEEKELEKKYGKKKVKKIERYIIFLIYALVFLIGGYFLITSAFPEIMPEEFYSYSISAEDIALTNNLRSLYLEDSDALGGITQVENTSARFIIVEKPFNFIFNPKRKVAENTTAQIQLQFVNPSTEIYLNENLIVPDLDDYKKVAEFPNESKEVWVKKDLLEKTPTENQTSEEFIYQNYPGKNIYSFGEMSGGTPIIADYKESLTYIKTRFRDNLKLAVYLKGDLKLDFIKQDLNICIGKDEYTITITDLKGNTYFNKTYGDDGDKKDSGVGVFEQEIHITGNNLPQNIYYITFTRDKNNKWEDSSIKEIKINSNKVLILGTILPISEGSFFTKLDQEESIKFRTYWRDKITMKVEGDLEEEFIIKKGEDNFLNLTKGEYTISDKEWKTWIIHNLDFSPKKHNWFYLPKTGNKKLLDSEIILIDKHQLNITKGHVVYTGTINVDEKSKIQIQALDKLETYFKGIKLVL